MRKQWFRWRRPTEGQGYSIASREGGIVTVAFVIVSTVSAVGPPIVGKGSAASIVLAGFLFCACIAALLVVVRAHSEWHG